MRAMAVAVPLDSRQASITRLLLTEYLRRQMLDDLRRFCDNQRLPASSEIRIKSAGGAISFRAP